MKTNLTDYGSQELDLIVMNDEYLYNAFMQAVYRDRFTDFLESLKEYYDFTEEQVEELEETFNSEREEYEKD